MAASDHDYGWPPRMIMRIACAYTGRSRWALARAAREGVLPVAGRNGRTLVFDRAALDAWMVGDMPKGTVLVMPGTLPRRAHSDTAVALLRLRQLKENAR